MEGVGEAGCSSGGKARCCGGELMDDGGVELRARTTIWWAAETSSLTMERSSGLWL
jgi:hypothetical protein